MNFDPVKDFSAARQCGRSLTCFTRADEEIERDEMGFIILTDLRPNRPRLSYGRIAMSLQRGAVLGYDFNRMVVDFTMLDQGKTVQCAITTAAMGDLEGKRDLNADQRIDQFLRLRDAIEERASSKYAEKPVESQGQIVLRSNDFAKK